MTKPVSSLRRFRRCLDTLAPEDGGVATIEFGLIASLIVIGILNVFDLGRYYQQRMQVQNATQMAAQAALATCDMKKLPATTKCPQLTTALTNALQSTSLGSAVMLKSGFPTEAYFCLDAKGELVRVSDASRKPLNCSAVGNPGALPADYLRIEASYAFAPLFPGVSVGSLLPSPITALSAARME